MKTYIDIQELKRCIEAASMVYRVASFSYGELTTTDIPIIDPKLLLDALNETIEE